MDRYEILATLVVVGIPIVVLALAVGAALWARDALGRRPPLGIVGILATATATANLFAERPLGDARTRAVMALFVEHGAAFRSALLGLALVLLLGVATSVAVRLPTSATR